MNFLKLEIFWKTYIPIEIILIRKWVKLIEKKKFITRVLNPEKETYVSHIISLVNFYTHVHPSWQTQVRGLLSTHIFITISYKYTNFADVFLLNLATLFPKYMWIKNPTIKLIDN